MTDGLVGEKERKYESRTLADRLMEIGNTPLNVMGEEKKEVECKKVVEGFLMNELVYGAINGEVDILDECKKIVDKYGVSKHFYPHYIGKKDMRTIRELEEIVGPLAAYKTKESSGRKVTVASGLNNEVSLFCNPVAAGVFLAGSGVFCIYPALKGRKEKMNRRLFLKTIGTVLGFGFLGALCTNDMSVEFLSEPQRVAIESARYVQTIISQLYKV